MTLKKLPTTLLLLLVFLLGLLVRLYDLTDEPLELHPTRQLRGAAIARGLYYQWDETIPEEQRQFGINQKDRMGLIEPPIQESLAALTYRIIGAEKLWIGRVYAILFWMLGGWALYALTRKFTTPAGSIAALSFYFFLPFGVWNSRTFMPDPIMASSLLIAVWALHTWATKRSYTWAVFTGLVTGFAILVKSVAAFILLPAFILFILTSFRFKKALRNRQLWTMALLAALPSLAYYYYGIFIDGRLLGQFSGRFFPAMWLDPGFYVQWLANLQDYLGLLAVLLGLFGLFLAERKSEAALLAGLWSGYVLYGLVFPHHIRTHDYYHLPLVPILALSLAPAAALLYQKVTESHYPKIGKATVLLAFALVSASNLWTARVALARQDFRQVAAMWKEIGDLMRSLPDEDLIALTADYESGLEFYGQVVATHWPSSGDLNFNQLQGNYRTFDQLWDLTEGKRYFLVVDYEEFEAQPDLLARLDEGYTILAEGEGYLLYDLYQPY